MNHNANRSDALARLKRHAGDVDAAIAEVDKERAKFIPRSKSPKVEALRNERQSLFNFVAEVTTSLDNRDERLNTLIIREMGRVGRAFLAIPRSTDHSAVCDLVENFATWLGQHADWEEEAQALKDGLAAPKREWMDWVLDRRCTCGFVKEEA